MIEFMYHNFIKKINFKIFISDEKCIIIVLERHFWVASNDISWHKTITCLSTMYPLFK